jgi:alkylation response protein AidB-like acyl-CoA dehydrogenase
MNLDFDETQLMLRTQARDFIAEKCPTTLVRELVLSDSGYSKDIWHEMAELGWMSIPFPEEYGGAGMTFFDVLILLEEMGRGAVPGPYLSTMLCGLAINMFGTREQKQEFLPRIAGGELIFALAWTEPSASFDPDGVILRANKGGGPKYSLVGTKLFCPDAHIADNLLVVARTADACDDNSFHGITLFITPAKNPAILCFPQPSIGFDNQSEIEFVNLVVDEGEKLGELNQGWLIVERIMSWGALGKCAEMIGAAEKAFEMAIDYANDRIQYGQHIGSFQVQQHRLADMWMSLEGSRNCFYRAGWNLSSGYHDPMLVSKVKAMVSDMTEDVTEKATLIHGAIGLSWDHDLGLYFRRTRSASLMYGDAEYHKEKVATIFESSSI